jgi:pimeloyl-ACP methyl ester carboxylesterase
VEGVGIRYVRAGKGPTVVLLHGIAASIYTWRHVLPALSADFDVVALDLPGFGYSAQPPDLTLGLYPRVVQGLLDRLGIEKAVLVGHSLGGAVAVTVAAEAPEGVGGLVLVDAAGFNLDTADRPFLLRLAGTVPAPLLDALPRRRLVRAGLRQVFHDDSKVTDEVVEEYLAPLSRPGAMASFRSLLAARDPGAARRVREAIEGVRVPTLIVWGRQDAWTPVAHAGRFAEAIPGSRVEILDGCGHVPQEERPEELVRLLRGFLERREGEGILGGLTPQVDSTG